MSSFNNRLKTLEHRRRKKAEKLLVVYFDRCVDPPTVTVDGMTLSIEQYEAMAAGLGEDVNIFEVHFTETEMELEDAKSQ